MTPGVGAGLARRSRLLLLPRSQLWLPRTGDVFILALGVQLPSPPTREHKSKLHLALPGLAGALRK